MFQQQIRNEVKSAVARALNFFQKKICAGLLEEIVANDSDFISSSIGFISIGDYEIYSSFQQTP